MIENQVLAACKKGIETWQYAFNRHDARGCAAVYAETAIMHARPFGIFEGREAIQRFWQGLIEQGFSHVTYSDIKWEKISGRGYILTAKWQMNYAFGVVHRECWTVGRDGNAYLTSDDFEILGER
jgi:ketosteroid isomerase-like protein